MGTSGGISRLDKVKKTWKTYSQKEGLTETEIKSLAKVKQRIWAGGIGGTLFEYDPISDQWKKIEPTDPTKKWRDSFDHCDQREGLDLQG